MRTNRTMFVILFLLTLSLAGCGSILRDIMGTQQERPAAVTVHCAGSGDDGPAADAE